VKEAVEILVALGSNLGRRRATLDEAVAALDAAEGVRVREVSPWIETEPVGGPPGQPRYWNGVLRADCELEVVPLMELLDAIERRFGRSRDGLPPDSPRTLDLDLLFYGDLEIDAPDLIVPHPRMEERVFVLEPLAHLAPDRRLPRCGLTVRDRLAELDGAAASRARAPKEPCRSKR
jgi:2-amino-4-hydroxy-6-hydroxymethyldihydropteridine diphosphokinase